jgi:hypothetical protein
MYNMRACIVAMKFAATADYFIENLTSVIEQVVV